MLPFLQLPPGYLWTLQALTKMSQPYSENNPAALGRAHPGPQRLSRQNVHADIWPDHPPLGSGTKVYVLEDGSLWSLHWGSTKAT